MDGSALPAIDALPSRNALAARLAASLWARYPKLSPETVRALMIHAARWSPTMLARCTTNGVLDTERLLRTFGYGQPDEEELYSSAANDLTLIAESRLHPFIKEDGAIKTRNLNLHRLPWPADTLRDLPLDTTAQLRVTLSYFVEPSPGERGWDRKYGYASHGLRFAVQRPTETVAQFSTRINAYGRDGPDAVVVPRAWEVAKI
jgi:Subtilase family